MTQDQLRQVLDLQAALRDERAQAAQERHLEVIGRLDALTAQQREMVVKQTEANGRTATNEQATKLISAAVAKIPCLQKAVKSHTCPEDAPAMEVSVGGVRWRPTKRQLAHLVTAIAGLLGGLSLPRLGAAMTWLEGLLR